MAGNKKSPPAYDNFHQWEWNITAGMAVPRCSVRDGYIAREILTMGLPPRKFQLFQLPFSNKKIWNSTIINPGVGQLNVIFN